MNIGVHDSDKTKFPNLALMKISAWHKKHGDNVEFYEDLFHCKYDKVYSSKVFTFTQEDKPVGNIEFGGTGYNLKKSLPDEIEHICPDYDLYGCDHSLGFLTRGCPNKCSWCIVPEKEGEIKPHADIEEFAKHKNVVLMDNNVLASEHGVKQIEKIVDLGLKIDFNQGLDAILIDGPIAKLLSKVKWMHPIRLACDKHNQMDAVQKAVTHLRWHNATPRRYFIYCLVKDIEDAEDRIRFLKGLDLDPHAQPYRDFRTNAEPEKIQKHFARWVNHKAVFKSTTWGEYKAAKNI